MKASVILIFFLFSNLLSGQISKFKLIDKIDKTPLKYANITSQNYDIGISSDSLGNFSFEKNSKININAVGYEKLTIDLSFQSPMIEINPKETIIKEVIIEKRKNENELIIDYFKTSKTNHYYALAISNNSSWIIGNYFENNQYKTKFIKSVKVITKSEISDAIFNIRLYTVDDNGKPLDEIYPENIITTAKKGKHKTDVDLSKKNIQIPKNGVFIAVDWIKNDGNIYEFQYKKKGSIEKLMEKHYEPSFGTVFHENENKTLIFMKNEWKPALKDTSNKSNNYHILSMELTLTD